MSKSVDGLLFGLAVVAPLFAWGLSMLPANPDPPDEVFGAKRSFCQEGPAGICCGYDGVDHEGDPCGIVLCRANDSDEWHIVMARCFRAKPKAEKPPKKGESI